MPAAAAFACLALGGAPAMAEHVSRAFHDAVRATQESPAPPEDPGVDLSMVDGEPVADTASRGLPAMVENDDAPAATIGMLPRGASRAPLPIDEEAADLAALAGALAEAGGLPDLTPLTVEPVRGSESSGFGWRDDPIRHRPKYHAGTDYRADRGTPVYASADATVAACGRHGGYGKLVQLSHGNGLVTRYGHLSKILVRCGDAVRADTLIGLVGSTGRATGPHLHFEVRIDGHPVDPNLAAHVGYLEREGNLESAALASLALQPELQADAISLDDPPRTSKRDRDEPKHASKRDKRDSKKHKSSRRRVS